MNGSACSIVLRANQENVLPSRDPTATAANVSTEVVPTRKVTPMKVKSAGSRSRSILMAGAIATTAALALVVAGSATAATAQSSTLALREVMFVGNNWDGTADVIDPTSFEKLDHFNVVPDLQERLADYFEVPATEVDFGYMNYVLPVRQEHRGACVDQLACQLDRIRAPGPRSECWLGCAVEAKIAGKQPRRTT